MNADNPMFQHLPLPALLWPVGGDVCANAAFLAALCPKTLPEWLPGRPDGAHLTRLPRRAGKPHICRVQLSTLPGGARLAVIEDVQDYHRDVLTGLDDRRALLLDCAGSWAGSWASSWAAAWADAGSGNPDIAPESAAETAPESVASPGGTLALLDIDRFKDVNDQLGHAAGDDVLCVLAGLLETTARYWQGRAYRLGGDEFVLVIPRRLEHDGLLPLQHHFQRSLRELGVRDLGTRGAGFSCGLAYAPQHGQTLHELLLHADTRLGERKRNRRGGLVAQLGRAMRDLGPLDSWPGGPQLSQQWAGL